jgi:hypothetical protein
MKNKISISGFQLVPFLGKENDPVAWVNFSLATPDGEDFLSLHSGAVFKNREDDPDGPYRIIFPAKPLSGGYNFFWKILNKELLKDLLALVSIELSRSGNLDIIDNL